MNIWKLSFSALALVASTATPLLPAQAMAAGIAHTFIMRGQIVDVSTGVPTVCIGKADGAKVGQTLDVIRVSSVPGTRAGAQFRREDVAKIRITEIVDDHFARAAVVSGSPEKHDIVELRSN